MLNSMSCLVISDHDVASLEVRLDPVLYGIDR